MKIPEQSDLFQEVVPSTISIDESAQRIGVSSATVRNWLKTGYLTSAGRGRISEDSLIRFQKETAGTEKLLQRANKSFKDSHDHDAARLLFIERANSSSAESETLGGDYESSLSDSYRNKEGIYYTPQEIVRDLLNIQSPRIEEATFCDPCCGSGNFIMRALELGFKPENVYGYDTDVVAIEIAKSRVREKYKYEAANIQVGDFLQLATERKIQQFDHIYTNPPWGKKIPVDRRKSLSELLKAGASLDTCSLFFFAILQHLKQNGTAGFLLPEAFFNISAFEGARVKALSLCVKRLVDYGKPFKGLVTKAQGIVLSNAPRRDDSAVICEVDGKCTTRLIESFGRNPKSILNLYCGQGSVNALEYLFSIPHITLHGRASWGLGIVTGNNDKYMRDSPEEGYIPVYKGADILQGGIKEASCFIPADFSSYQQVAPLRLFQSKEKLIYKFISSRLCFFCDAEQRFVINSANMLIPHSDFPISNKVLAGLLSSDFMNWVFASIFNTHKILRGDLESLPIHHHFLEGEYEFDERSYIGNLNIEKRSDGTYRTKD